MEEERCGEVEVPEAPRPPRPVLEPFQQAFVGMWGGGGGVEGSLEEVQENGVGR